MFWFTSLLSAAHAEIEVAKTLFIEQVVAVHCITVSASIPCGFDKTDVYFLTVLALIYWLLVKGSISPVHSFNLAKDYYD